MGELVIAQTMVGQDELIVGGRNHELNKKISQAGKIVRELHDLSMILRMVPLKGTFQKMARLARDLSQKNGKTVKFITEGEDIEIDRNMVDMVADPLVHLIRNAIDHGIETPEERRRIGKSEEGQHLFDGRPCRRQYHADGLGRRPGSQPPEDSGKGYSKGIDRFGRTDDRSGGLADDIPAGFLYR